MAEVVVIGAKPVMATMRRLQRELGASERRALSLAARATLNALSGTVRLSQKKRRVYAAQVPRKDGRGSFTGFFAENYTQNGGRKDLLISDVDGRWPKNKSEAKKSKAVVISRRGLAKKSVWWAGRKAKQGGAKDAPADARSSQLADEAARASRSDFKARDPYVFISDRLPYITKSFFQQGDHTVDTLAHRAQRWLEEYAKREAAKAARKAART